MRSSHNFFSVHPGIAMALDRQTTSQAEVDTTVRGSWWSVVINNPTDEDRVLIRTPPNWLRRVKGQDEVGEQGTLHIQSVLNTDQVRFGSIKKWLPRAHIDKVNTKLHYNRLLDYVHKDETCADVNSRFDIVIRGDDDVRTMDGILTRMAVLSWSHMKICETMKADAQGKFAKTTKEVYELEYWDIVRQICKQEPALISTFTVPNLRTAWINTRDVWIEAVLVDRQTNITVAINSPDTV